MANRLQDKHLPFSDEIRDVQFLLTHQPVDERAAAQRSDQNNFLRRREIILDQRGLGIRHAADIRLQHARHAGHPRIIRAAYHQGRRAARVGKQEASLPFHGGNIGEGITEIQHLFVN